MNKRLTPYDDPLTALSEIGPPLTAAALNKAAVKRKERAVKRRTPCLPGTPPFAAGQLTPHDAILTYDSSLEHFEAFFQNMVSPCLEFLFYTGTIRFTYLEFIFCIKKAFLRF